MDLGNLVLSIDELVEADPHALRDKATYLELLQQRARLQAVLERAATASAPEKAMTADEMLEVGPRGMAGRESIVELYRMSARLQALVVEATAVFDAGQVWAGDGAKSAVSWLVYETKVPRGVAARNVRLGRVLRDLPVCERAFRDGDISVDHLSVIAAARTDRTAEALARDEAMLVGYATNLRFDQFRSAVAYWKYRADPDGGEDDERRRFEGRNVYLELSLDGMYLGRMTLDPISGVIVSGELRRIEEAMFDADWAQAEARLGRRPTLRELGRSSGQRRADALVEMATRSASLPGGARRPDPLFTVLVDYETMHGRVCELANGPMVAPGALLPWLSSAFAERAVFKPPRRVECSELDRFFTGATRRSLEIRDRECTHKYCDIPSDRCQADHIIPYRDNGPTTQDNGDMKCPFHNGQKGDRSPPPDENPDEPPNGQPTGLVKASAGRVGPNRRAEEARPCRMS